MAPRCAEIQIQKSQLGLVLRARKKRTETHLVWMIFAGSFSPLLFFFAIFLLSMELKLGSNIGGLRYNHRCPFWLVCLSNRGGLFHLPGPSIFPKGHLWLQLSWLSGGCAKSCSPEVSIGLGIQTWDRFHRCQVPRHGRGAGAADAPAANGFWEGARLSIYLSILFYSMLFYSILFCSVLFYSIVSIYLF